MQEMLLTPREAAFVLDESVKSIQKVLDSHTKSVQKVRHGRSKVRVLDRSQMLYFLALRKVGDNLSPLGRDRLFDALVESGVRRRKTLSVSSLMIDLEPCEDELDRKLKDYESLKGEVETRESDGEALLRGTGVEVYRVAALLDGGASPADVLRDFPSLTGRQVEVARQYAEAMPKQGRPYPKTSFKRAVAELGLDALDEFLETRGTE